MTAFNYPAAAKRKEKREKMYGDYEKYKKEKEEWLKKYPWRKIYPGDLKR